MKKPKLKAKVDGTKVITGVVRFSYVHIWEPSSINGGEEKYSVSLLIDKGDTDTLEAIDQAIKQAIENGKSKLGGKINNLKLPLRDGDAEREDDLVYENMMFINASSKTKPSVVNKKLVPITNSEELYSGCYGRASVNFYIFNNNGNRGVACGINHIMKTADGDFLGGRSKAEDDFAGFADLDTTDFEDDDEDDADDEVGGRF
ncbi:MAG: DUF2815 family protein [Bacillota bacterium]